MRRLLAILATVTALAVAGCGTDDADSAGDSDSATSAEPTASSSPGVESVSLTRTGGIAGVRESWTIGQSDRGHAAVFEAASRQAIGDAEAAKGAPPCCDLFQYDVIVRYTDGTTASYRVYDGGTSDPALDQLVSAVLNTEPATSGPTAKMR